MPGANLIRGSELALEVLPWTVASVTVAAAATIGRSTRSADLAWGLDVATPIMGVWEEGNQDQDVASVVCDLPSTAAISAVVRTAGSPLAFTTAAHGLASGDIIVLSGITGLDPSGSAPAHVVAIDAGYHFTVDVVDSTHFTLTGTDGVNYTNYTSGGTIRQQNKGVVKVTLGAAATADNVFKVTVWKRGAKLDIPS